MRTLNRIVHVGVVGALLLLAPTVKAQVCDAPPLFDMTGPTCTVARQDTPCGCSECFQWGAAARATWYEVRRCDSSGENCTIVGNTRALNRAAYTDANGVFHPEVKATRWCVPWDNPFPLIRGAYDYSVRSCTDAVPVPLCSSFSTTPIRYAAAPYMCIAGGVEIACLPTTPPPPGFATDMDGDGITDAIDTDDDGDGREDKSDNCPLTINIGQRDTDKDGVGDACDATPRDPGSLPPDADHDGIRDRDDLCLWSHDPSQVDTDRDRTGDSCDNCPTAANERQTDSDQDRQGDRCDLDDGPIYLVWNSRTQLAWAKEVGYTTWSVYRGDLAELRRSGTYTQASGSNPLAARFCALTGLGLTDATNPTSGKTAFYLVGGRPGSFQADLGLNSAGTLRPNANPCP